MNGRIMLDVVDFDRKKLDEVLDGAEAFKRAFYDDALERAAEAVGQVKA